MKSLSLVFLAIALCLGASSALPSLSTLLYEFTSTLRVVEYICLSGACSMNDQLAKQFFDCYDAAPAGGKEIYTQCQQSVNGGVMNTTAGIRLACKGLYKFPAYAKCLSDKFEAVGIDMHLAVTDVNKCEEKVLGTGSLSR